jgi:hypothetical protein
MQEITFHLHLWILSCINIVVFVLKCDHVTSLSYFERTENVNVVMTVEIFSSSCSLGNIMAVDRLLLLTDDIMVPLERYCTLACLLCKQQKLNRVLSFSPTLINTEIRNRHSLP